MVNTWKFFPVCAGGLMSITVRGHNLNIKMRFLHEKWLVELSTLSSTCCHAGGSYTWHAGNTYIWDIYTQYSINRKKHCMLTYCVCNVSDFSASSILYQNKRLPEVVALYGRAWPHCFLRKIAINYCHIQLIGLGLISSCYLGAGLFIRLKILVNLNLILVIINSAFLFILIAFRT